MALGHQARRLAVRPADDSVEDNHKFSLAAAQVGVCAHEQLCAHEQENVRRIVLIMLALYGEFNRQGDRISGLGLP